ncbi:unnamed protein product [Moneuplotes crassus]|uniref:Uncharacterized protein n=1 Tax=Euplotes crassus TaxID=5936 RepID=A0AAD1X4Q6_EUPCR|nr:unnamed protein product [Moneuplotes crassus]
MQGYFREGEICKPCLSECKECNEISSCSACEDYMFMNSTNSLCEKCPIGTYYGATGGTCKSCEGSCEGPCKAQLSCITCPLGEILNLSTLKCDTSCNGVVLESDILNLPPYCKPFGVDGVSMEYYIDPQSSQPLELGTLEYPYRSFKAANLEITSFFSHSIAAITIFTKSAYLQDNTNYYINMTAVGILPHPQLVLLGQVPTLIPTAVKQHTTHKRALFHLLNTTFVNLEMSTQMAINNGDFGDYEEAILKQDKVTVLPLRTSFILQNINIYREETQPDEVLWFMILGNLQEKFINIKNINLNITGSFIETHRAANIVIENIKADLVRQDILYRSSDLSCNDPDSFLTPTVVFSNFSFVNSNVNNGRAPKDVLRLNEVGNTTAVNIDCRNHFTDLTRVGGCVGSLLNPSCLPDDSQLQAIQAINVTIDNISSNRRFITGNAINADIAHYRNVFINIQGFKAQDININSPFPLFGVIATYHDAMILQDSEIRNAISTQFLTGGVALGNFTSLNNVFRDIDGGIAPPMMSRYCYLTNLQKFKLVNYTSSISATIPLLYISPFDFSHLSIDEIHIEDCNFANVGFIAIDLRPSTLQITNGYFKNTELGMTKEFFRVSNVGNFLFSNHTIIDCSSIDQDSFSFLLKIGLLNLNEADGILVEDIIFFNSSISLIDVGTLYQTLTHPKTFIVKDITYSNCSIPHSNALISTQGHITNESYTINFLNIAFTNIVFQGKGTLINFGHQLTDPILVANLTIVGVSSCKINVESFYQTLDTLKTRVNIQGMVSDRVFTMSQPFIRTYIGGVLNITLASFTNTESLNVNSGIFSTLSDSVVSLQNAVFQNNSGISAILFKISDKSRLICRNCTIANNFALSKAIVSTETDGSFEFISSNISQNYALENSIGEVFGLLKTSIIESSNIFENLAISKSAFDTELISCEKLCFLGPHFLQYLLNLNTTSLTFSNVAIQVLYGTLEIRESTQIYNQQKFINAFTSTVRIIDSSISQIVLERSNIDIIFSELILSNVTMSNIINPLETEFILVTSESKLHVTNTTFKSSHSSLFSIQSSGVELISDLKFVNVSNVNSLIKVIGATHFTADKVILNQSIATDQLLEFNDAHNISIKSIEVSDMNVPLIKAIGSSFLLLQDIMIRNSTKSLDLNQCVVVKMTRCNFQDNGNNSTSSGGAIRLLNSNITIDNSLFIRNHAIQGGAISFSCISKNNCYLDVQNSTFSMNIASKLGGAIYYDYTPPNKTDVVFLNNSAPYGQDLASYPFRIGLLGSTQDGDIKLDSIGSGIVIEPPLKLALFDYDNQIMNQDSSSQLIITSADLSKGTISGTNVDIVKNGVATFDEVKATATPGSTSIKFKVSSKIFDKNKLSDVFNKSSGDTNIIINFRYCKPGEQQIGGTCSECNTGTYSLNWNSTSCYKCIDNAQCNGGNNVEVKSGYWRRLHNSSTVVECLYGKACKGGFLANSTSPVQCDRGYGGPMCSQCEIIDGAKYEKTNEFQCAKCPNPLVNAFRVFGLMILVFLYFMALIVLNVRKTKESQMSVLLRILTNYMQLITTSMSMSLSYPSFLDSFTGPLKRMGGSSDTFLSFDCFVTDYEIKGPFQKNSVFKLFLLIFLPLALFFVISLIWVVIYLIKRRWMKNIQRNLTISFISVVFLLHPRLTQAGINIWRCVKIDEDVEVARFDMSFECYSAQHLKYCFTIGLPILLFWSILTPLVAFILLCKNRQATEENKVRKYFLVLYQGLTPECYYWEFVNTVRKSLVLALLVLPETTRITLSSIILLLSGRIQLNLKPYKKDENNQVEFLAISAGAITILSGIVFSEKNPVESLNTLTLFIIIGLNIFFLLSWLYLLAQEFSEKSKIATKISTILACLICLRQKKTSAIEKEPKETVKAKENVQDPPVPALIQHPEDHNTTTLFVRRRRVVRKFRKRRRKVVKRVTGNRQKSNKRESQKESMSNLIQPDPNNLLPQDSSSCHLSDISNSEMPFHAGMRPQARRVNFGINSGDLEQNESER